uniref:Uncharacterized protein n=1 Tax=Globodera rostochiensis TaxID=31243 RepID=A0A914GQI2_GLORO
MSSAVRFSSASLSRGVPPPLTASKDCQTVPVHFASIGTDPIQAPEKGTQSEAQQQPIKNECYIRINAELVGLIMGELDRARREEELLAVYERQLAFGDDEKRGRRVQLRHFYQLMAEPDHLDHSIGLSSVHYGPGARVILLFGFPQHDTCTRRGQRGRVSTVPLSTCPSTAEFARYGELVIVGTHSGELLLLSSESGDVLWSSESTSALSHAFTVTQLRWVMDSGGSEQQRELISLSLDGTVRKSRLEANNRLELLQSANFKLGDLPRELRKGGVDGGAKLGLIGCVFDDEANLLVATETGIVLRLDTNGLVLKDTFVLGDSAEDIPTIKSYGALPMGSFAAAPYDSKGPSRQRQKCWHCPAHGKTSKFAPIIGCF